MDAWLANVIRQIILYSLPLLISLTLVGMLEARLRGQAMPHPFHPIAWRGTWLPWLAGLLFTRGVIIALPQPQQTGIIAAAARLLGHAGLTLAGFLLYTWSLHHMGESGLPPLHHWWAKVLMYFNLCMVTLHLLPLPGMMMGEWLATTRHGRPRAASLTPERGLWLWVVIAASPLRDWSLGAWLVYPAYEWLATAANHL